MVRTLLMLLPALAALVPVRAAFGDNWCSRTWSDWRRQYRYNVAWPDQFIPADQCAVRAPFQAMVANGWRAQNTICAYHFHEATGELNDTGLLKMRAVLQATPPEYRQLYVLRGETPAMTAARIRAVQQEAEAIMQGEAIPPIMITTFEPRGVRGEVVNGVNTRYLENAPVPQLPQVTRSSEE